MSRETEFPVVIFLSHAQADGERAKRLASWIEGCFPGMVNVFVSGRWGNIELGVEWFDKITDALKHCKVGLVLVTPNSVRRPWVNIEVGGLKLLGKRLIPICVEPTQLLSLPSPLDRQQACQYEDAASLLSLIRSIASSVGLPKEWIERNVTKRQLQHAPKLGPIPLPDDGDGPKEGHQPAIEGMFETDDRWTTVVYTCRATFTGETCPLDTNYPVLRKALSSHVPVDEMQTVCTAVNHLMPKEERAHEDDILETVMCSKQAAKALFQPRDSLPTGVPALIDRDLIVIGENNFGNLLLHMMKPYLPWERHLHWQREHPDKPGRPMVFVQYADHALPAAPPRQIKSVGRGGGMICIFPSPLNVRKRVLIVFGCHREGQFALENWLRGAEVNTIVSAIKSCASASERSGNAIQVVVQSGGAIPREGTTTWEAGTISNVNNPDRPFWLTPLRSVGERHSLDVNPSCESQAEMYDVSLVAELSPEIQTALKQEVQGKIQAPDLYWEDEQCEIGFHITLFEYFTHDRPTSETIRSLDEAVRLLRPAIRDQTRGDVPPSTCVRIRGIEVLPTAVISYADFLAEDTSSPNWLASVRVWGERQARAVTRGQRSQSVPPFNRNRVPFPAHITLCRFNRRIEADLERRIRETAARTRSEEIKRIDLTSVSLALAKRRPYRQVEVLERIELS